jgi:hypothetical protein
VPFESVITGYAMSGTGTYRRWGSSVGSSAIEGRAGVSGANCTGIIGDKAQREKLVSQLSELETVERVA